MQNNYRLKITKKAEKFIQKQNKDDQKRIIGAILGLPEGDIKKLKGMDKIFRL